MKFEPFVVAFNGKSENGAAGRVFRNLRRGRPQLGLAKWKLGVSQVYVLPSSSGSSANPRDFSPKASKSDWWREFGDWLRSSLDRQG